MKNIFEQYAIINSSDLSLIDFNQIGETSENTLRYSLDASQFVIKWDSTPTFIADGSVVPAITMKHSQAIELMQTEAWQEPFEG